MVFVVLFLAVTSNNSILTYHGDYLKTSKPYHFRNYRDNTIVFMRALFANDILVCRNHFYLYKVNPVEQDRNKYETIRWRSWTLSIGFGEPQVV